MQHVRRIGGLEQPARTLISHLIVSPRQSLQSAEETSGIADNSGQ